MNQREIEDDTQVIPLAGHIDSLFDSIPRHICFRVLSLVTKKITSDIVKESGFTEDAKRQLIDFFQKQLFDLEKIMENRN